jgi:diguanylate cyclase (GGDEF)-like protein
MADPRRSLDVLLGLTRALAELRPLEEALQSISDAALQLLPGDHASIRLLDDSRQELLCGARSGEASKQGAVTFKAGDGVLGWVVEHGEAARIDDVALDPRFAQKSGQGFSIGSILAVPLYAGQRVLGVVSITSKAKAAFSVEDLALLQLLTNCTVPPIDRARLERLAITDPQTLAFTQSHLLPRLEEEMRKARDGILPLSLFALKPEHFDAVNQRFGKEHGDQVLRVFAGRVRACLRRNDALVRRAGVEFCAILPDTGLQSAKSLAERIRLTVSERPVPVPGGLSANATVSIGWATWDGREPVEKLLERAERARVG